MGKRPKWHAVNGLMVFTMSTPSKASGPCSSVPSVARTPPLQRPRAPCGTGGWVGQPSPRPRICASVRRSRANAHPRPVGRPWWPQTTIGWVWGVRAVHDTHVRPAHAPLTYSCHVTKALISLIPRSFCISCSAFQRMHIPAGVSPQSNPLRRNASRK